MGSFGPILGLVGVLIAAAGVWPITQGLGGKPARRTPNVFLCLVIVLVGAAVFAASMFLGMKH